jgi:muramoyltetrapeptide carboxypeptidase
MERVVRPKMLKAGDSVGIISPSSLITRTDIRRGIEILRSMGLSVRLGANALRKRYGYQAGSPEERVSDFNEMFSDPSIKGIFCTTGGYSAIQLLPDIDWDLIKKNPKVFVGYSDITTLLNAIYRKTGLVTFHGPLIEGLGKYMNGGCVYTVDSLTRTLMEGGTGPLPSYTKWSVLKPGIAEGTLIGGNLNVLLSLIGTPYEPKWEGSILFLEEVDDTDESIDHCMWCLRIAGVFDAIRGIIVGKFTKMYSIRRDGSIPPVRNASIVRRIILSATEGFNFPILYGVDFGHYVPSLTIPVGARASIDCRDVNGKGSFSIVEKYLR